MGLMTNINIYLIAITAAFVAAVIPEMAHASVVDGLTGSGEFNLGGLSIGFGEEAGGIAAALCQIVSWFQGGVGQSIASLAIIFLGISAFFGKVTWGTALLFAAGVFAIFGSSEIVSAITGGRGNGCCGGLNVSVGIDLGSVGFGANKCFK